MIAASVVLGYICLKQSYLQLPLLPAADSALAWEAKPSWDTRPGGTALMQLREAGQQLRFDFSIAKSVDAFAGAELFFHDSKGQPIHVDLSRYSAISLLVQCSPANTLALSIPTFVGGTPKQQEFLSYRTPIAYFSCDEHPSRVELDLTRLETPQWWFAMAGQALSRQTYKLDKVPKIAIGSTFQSPRGASLAVRIGELELKGRDRRYLLLYGAVLALAWSGFGAWFFRKHAQALVDDVKGKLQKDLPFVAYQQLSMEPHRDKEKTAILQFIASHYADAELDLDSVVEQTGVTRNKIYDILKTELGFTFSSYLNKLRLTEAARLLAAKDTATVAEIAYSVGYGNVSYFNKLFKEEYGCTPKTFRGACPR
ncbi:helix-turn-helix transcriptional regulator [Duganella rhizosphaerae]|uniref:helix-turn-helix transcriptional regulator n=1 Tax=Duganella rhizosphaerae TaxID=2885763 RepID=UPI00403F154E